MKNRSQVSRWLEKQEWYEQWVENMYRQNYLDGYQIDEYKSGLHGDGTIFCSLVFAQTPEGEEFWIDVNNQFTTWYYNDGLKKN